jgi:hypothetical protein
MELIFEKFDIKALRTSSYHPETDGESERFIQTMKSMLKSFVNSKHNDWDDYLDELSFAYNTSIHNATKFSPFEVTFGRIPRIPVDLIFDNHINDIESICSDESLSATNDEQNLTVIGDKTNDFIVLDNHEEILSPKINITVKKYCESVVPKLNSMYEMVFKNKTHSMDLAKVKHDRKIKKFSYNVGDLVLSDHVNLKVGQSSGLAHKYHGPFEITGVHNNKCNYIIKKRLDNGKLGKKAFIIHKNRLKVYFGHYNDNLQDKNKVTEVEENKSPRIDWKFHHIKVLNSGELGGTRVGFIRLCNHEKHDEMIHSPVMAPKQTSLDEIKDLTVNEDKYAAIAIAKNMEMEEVEKKSEQTSRVPLVIKNLELVPKYGTILELYANNLRDVISVIDEGCQTVISLGFSGNDILEEIKSTGIKGIDRIVGMGQAFDMSTVWDGYDLITEEV